MEIPVPRIGKQGKTVDFLLTAKRDTAEAKRFFDKDMGRTATRTRL